jgi:hypothetical protein
VSAQRVSLTCDEVEELSGLYVLGALTPDEEEQVREHLATCDQAHASLEAMAPVVPGLLETIEPIDPPETLRASVLAAIAETPQLGVLEAGATTALGSAPAAVSAPVAASAAAAGSAVATAPEPISLDAERARRRPQGWERWVRPVLAAAAVLVIVVLGATVVVQQRNASDNAARSQALQTALAILAQPGAQFARMEGSGSAAGATGIAAFPAGGQTGTIVMQGLAPLSSDHTYQAWLIASGAPVSAGLMSVGSDGLAIQQGIAPLSGAQVVALTVENAGGADQPTGQPIVVGQIQTVPAATAGRPSDAGYAGFGVASLAVMIVPGPWRRARSRAPRAAASNSVPDEPSLTDEEIPAARPATPRS